MLTPEEQAPDHVMAALRPLLTELYRALEIAAAKTDAWFRDDDGGHQPDPYYRAMSIRIRVREQLQAWKAGLPMEDVEDSVEIHRPSNVGLHIMWQGRYLIRVRMGDEQAAPVPSTGSATSYFNQPLIGLEMPILRLFVLWRMTTAGVRLYVACPHSAEKGRKESLRWAWWEDAQHPAEITLPDIAVARTRTDDEDVPWRRDIDAEEAVAEEPRL